jgi:aerobic carbon-monoxide dehydrogenase small subunit
MPELDVNGARHVFDAPALKTLAETLRDDLGLTGTKEACGVGACGACSVTIDGDLVSSCILPIALADGRSVGTIEGLAGDGQATAVQEAFVDAVALQCGFCTPGQVMTASALLAAHPDPSDDTVTSWMAGNLCRCTGYSAIRRAIRAVGTGS